MGPGRAGVCNMAPYVLGSRLAPHGSLARRAGVFKGHCKGHSAKRITPKNRPVDFYTPAQKGQKEGSRFHPSKPAVILAGFAVPSFQAL